MIGTRLGPYKITAKLGEGGMGEVWRAKDSQLGREVALKLLPEAFTSDPERAARFEREAKVLASLNHPNIAQIYGLEASGESRALVMELVEGPTLADRLESGSLPLEESLSIARQIAEALEEAHEKGIIHRDLKPQNIKASLEGKVKVLDFGLAKAMDPAGASGVASASQLAASPTLTLGATVQGVILGTAAYMSPEQAKGLAVDKRADIWAFGVVLYEMLTGRRLFSGDTVPEVLAGVIKSEIDLAALPAEAPASIRRLVRRCLERRPQERLRDIGDARIVLAEAIAGGIAGESAPSTEAAKRSLGAPAAAALAAVAALAAGYLLGRGRAAEPASPSASERQLAFSKLTSRPGQEITPALSPDGKALYFSARTDEDSSFDIFFVPVGGTRPINLTADSPADDLYPAVSPDGRQVAFRSDRGDGGIYLMGTTGESVRRLVDGCFDPAWSPAGDRIVCTTCSANNPFSRGCEGSLRVVEVASGATTDLATSDAAGPAWSPDGRRIAYWGLSKEESGHRDLWTVAVAGGEPVRLTEDAAVDWNPEWSKEGRWLDFLSNRGGSPNLWRLEVDPVSGRARGEPESVTLPTEFADEVRSRAGRRAYVSRSNRATIEATALDDGHRALTGAARPVVATTGRMQAVAVSPDSASVAYSTEQPQQDLFVVGIGGGTPVQLTNDPALDRFPSWDPNGESILFMSNRSGRYETWRIRADGSGIEQLTLTEDESRWAPILSPDRRWLATNSERGTTLFDASGPPPWSRFERLPNPVDAPGEIFESNAWSPDGSRLAGFVRGSTHTRPAWLDLGERKPRVLAGRGVAIGWLADSRRLLVSGPEGLSIVDTLTAEVQPIAMDSAAASVRWRLGPDARTLVGFRNFEEADIWLAEGSE